MFSLSQKVRSTKGFTLVETLVAIGVFVLVMGLSVSIFTDAFSINRKMKISRVLYEESRIALERVVKEIRRGTVDYEEYWSWHHATGSGKPETDDDYGQNYGEYAAKFYENSNSRNLSKSNVDRHSENIGENTASGSALGDATSSTYGDGSGGNCTSPNVPTSITDSTGYTQCELYLINAEGTEKTIIKLKLESVNNMTEYRLIMLKLIGSDADGDAQVDTWTPLVDYKNSSGAIEFQKIQPGSIKITNLKFFISPLEDPRKAFAEFTNDVQIQIHPHITIQLTARPSGAKEVGGQWVMAGVKGKAPEITLQTTISARAQNEVVSLKP